MLLNYYIIYVLFTLFVYALGWLANHAFKKEEDKLYQKIFSNFYIGIFLVVCVFAIYQTNFKTVFVLVPILFGLYVIIFKKSIVFNQGSIYNSLKNGKSFKSIFLILSIFTFFYLFQYYTLFGDFTGKIPKYIPNVDYISYARISEYLVLTGKENIWQVQNLISEEYYKTTPYHYFNEWLVAFLIKITEQKSIFLQEIVINSFLLSMIACGFISLIEHFKKNINILDLFIGILCVFLKFIITIKFLSGIDFFSNNGFSMPKIAFLYIAMIYTSVLFLQKNIHKGILNLLLIPIAYFTATPAILMSAVVILLVISLLEKDKKKEILKLVLLPFILFGLIILFYQLTGDSSQNIHYEPINSIKFYIKTGINIIGGTFLQIMLLSLPFFVFMVLVVYIKKITFRQLYIALNPIYLPLFLIVASAGCCWALFNPMIDSVQLFQNIGVVCLNMIFTISFLYLLSFERRNNWGYFIFFTIIGLCIFQTDFKKYPEQFYSEKYLNDIKNVIKEYKLNPLGASLFGVDDYKPENTNYYINHKFSVNTNVSVLGANLKYVANNFNTICLSVHDIPNKNDKFVSRMIEVSCFDKYFKKIKGKNVIEARKKFIKDYKINYIVASKFADIDFLIKDIKTIIVDENTQEKFIVLKTQ